MTELEKKPIDYEEAVLKGVKNDFFIKTNRHIKVVVCDRWESEANFTFNIPLENIIKMVFDYTGWLWKDTFSPDSNMKSRSGERVYRRSLIDFLAINNGVSLMYAGKFSSRDHTTVLHSLRNFERRLETDGYVRQAFLELTNFCRTNYYLYKDAIITKDQLISGEVGDVT